MKFLRLSSLFSVTGLCLLIMILAIMNISLGSVSVPLAELIKIMSGSSENAVYYNIVVKSRLPQILVAILAGAGLSVSGLMLQTLFKNPLAGPSVLGITSGSSLGVALVTMFFTGALEFGQSGSWVHVSELLAAFGGAVGVMFIILYMAVRVKNNAMLLIVGLMIGYIASSVVSVIKFYSTQENIHAYVMWGMGSFSGTGWKEMPWFVSVLLPAILASLLLIKPLNMLSLGERYAQNLGLNVSRSRIIIIALTSLLAAAVTAFCGPIGFLGLAVPHVARLSSPTSDHRILLPRTILIGGAMALLCNLLARLPWSDYTLPVNAVTSMFGAPVVIYIIIKKRNAL